MNVLVTGGAGFIGSHLVQALSDSGNNVSVLDNLSAGSMKNLHDASGGKPVNFYYGDCRDSNNVRKAMESVDVVFHFAANPEVRLELASPRECYQQNIKATYVILEELRKSDAKKIVFASSSTIYGEATILPTPEHYGPLKPISIYGASKLACEALVSSYCHSFGKKAIIIRPANVVGSRGTHGVIFDFSKRLSENPRRLDVYGDGTQAKSYVHVKDFVDAVLIASEADSERFSMYNVGAHDQTAVAEIANIVIEEMSLRKISEIRFIGGVDGGRGWVGDVKHMCLDIERIESLGWKPRWSSSEAVRLATRDILAERRVLKNQHSRRCP